MTNSFMRLSITLTVLMLLGVVICAPMEKEVEVRRKRRNKKDGEKNGQDDGDLGDWDNSLLGNDGWSNNIDIPFFGGGEEGNQGLDGQDLWPVNSGNPSSQFPGGNLGVPNFASFQNLFGSNQGGSWQNAWPTNQYVNPESPFTSFGTSQNLFGNSNQGNIWASILPYLLNFGTGNQGSSFGNVENWSASDIQEFLAYFSTFFSQNVGANQGSWTGQSIGWPASGGVQSGPRNGWSGTGGRLRPGQEGGYNPGQWGGNNPGQWGGNNPGQGGGYNPGQWGGYNPGQGGGYNPGQGGGYNPNQGGIYPITRT